MYKKAWCTCKVVVLLIQPIVLLTFSLPSASLDLKVPKKDDGETAKKQQVYTVKLQWHGAYRPINAEISATDSQYD